MIRIDRALGAYRASAKMLLTVHDELIFEVKDTEVERVSALVKQEMESAMTLDVPLRVDVGCATTWADAH